MMGLCSRLWFCLHSCMYVLVAFSGVSGQSSECEDLKQVFPKCLCSRKLDSTGVILGTSVDCSARGLTLIPSSTRRFSIYELKLNNNSIVSLGDSILNNLDITRLDLSDNAIGSVHNQTFGYLGSYLKILILSGNSYSQPPKNAFQHLTLLEDLTLKNYNVPVLNGTSAYFLSFQKLRSLTLDKWKLESVDPVSFQFTGSNMLQSLTLINQVMDVLPIDELRSTPLRDLKTVHISQTNIYEITHDSFAMLSRLTELDLSYNKIASLSPNCFNGANGSLAKLSLSNNNLTSTSLLPGLTYLTKLQQLDLSFNQITNVPDFSMIHTTSPLALYLNNNGITAVPENAFVGITDKLKTLDLSYNRILNFQASFGRFTLIESLFLSHQSISSPLVTPSSLGQAAGTLKQLSLGGHTLQADLWSVVVNLYMLEILNLTSARMTSIPNFVLSNLTNLKKLDLSNNNLKNITQDTLVGPRNSLKFLSLTGNQISTLSSCMLYQYTSYPISMFLGENLLTCDCSVRWLWNSIRNGNITFIAGQEAVCSDNQLLANKTVDNFCTSPYTEPQCFEYYTTTTTPVPKVTIFVDTIGPNSIKISWQLLETNDLKEFKVRVSDSLSPEPVFENSSTTTFQIVNIKLKENTKYEVCVEAHFNTHPPTSNCTSITIPVTSGQEIGLSNMEKGIIIGVIVGVVVLLALVAAIIYLLVCHRRNKKKMPDNVPAQPRNFTKSELPSMNEETRTFTKPKRSRGASGPETREGMQVVAISDGQTGHGRVGRANLLNSDGSFKKARTSNSSSTSGQVAYENDHGPLPPTPDRQHSAQPPAGYYNKGFTSDSYEEIAPKRESTI